MWGNSLLNKEWSEGKDWIKARAGKQVQVSLHISSAKAGADLVWIKVEKTMGTLTHFIIEPFLPHPSNSEFYICINSAREGDIVLFTHEGGVEVGDVDAKALQLLIPVGGELPSRETIKKDLLSGVEGEERKEALVDFLARLYSVYVDLHFAYLEINPLVAVEVNGKTEIFYLDMAAKLDQVSPFISPFLFPRLMALRATDRRVDRRTQVGYRERSRFVRSVQGFHHDRKDFCRSRTAHGLASAVRLHPSSLIPRSY